MSVFDATLEELENALMVNSHLESELHYDVTIRLVQIVKELKANEHYHQSGGPK